MKRWLFNRGVALLVTIGVNILLIVAMARLNSYAKTQRSAVKRSRPIAIPLIKRKLVERRSKPKHQRSTGRRRHAALPTLNIPSSVQLPAWDDSESESDSVKHVEALRHTSTQRKIFSAAAVDEPPRVLASEPPRYPAQAEAQGVEGEVVARILVDTEGRVRQVVVLRSRPPGVFDSAATEALEKWRFTPCLVPPNYPLFIPAIFHGKLAGISNISVSQGRIFLRNINEVFCWEVFYMQFPVRNHEAKGGS